MPEQNSSRVFTPRWLRNAFLATDVSVQVDDEWLSAAEAAQVLRSPVFVITAWNPYSESRTDVENAAANELLRKRLVREGATIHPAIGSDPKSDWSEESFAVEGLGRKKARAIGKEFEQHAIFEVSREELIVLGCTGEWSEHRLHGIWSAEPQSTDDLSAVIKRVTGLDLSSRYSRAAELGWVHDDGIGAPCPNCGEPLELFGCELESKDRNPYRAMAFVCVAEELLLWPHQVGEGVRASAKARRRYLQARADADGQGRVDRTHWAYCIELDDGAGERSSDHPWVYVGQTATTPEERFEQHRSGYKASKHVRRHGVRLRPDLYGDQPVLRTKAEAESYEAWLALSMRANGWPVLGGH